MANVTSFVAKYNSKASGVYREIIDATASVRMTTSTNVVIVIQSTKGPVMNPIRVQNAEELHTIFGYRDAKLESKGNYGILMAEHVLELGYPVWILNIKNINANTETLQVVKLACSNADHEELADETISTVFDTTKFWVIDKSYGTYGDSPVLAFAAVQTGDITVVITKYNDTDKLFDYTVAYTKQFNPTFLGQGLNDNARVSEYMVQVDVFKTNLATAAINVVGGIVNGRVNVAKLDELRADANAKHYATYTGAVGNVIDKSGNNLNISTVINADYLSSGVWCALNSEQIASYGIDIPGVQALQFDATGAELPTVAEVTRLGETFTPQTDNLSLELDTDMPTVAYKFVDVNSDTSIEDILAKTIVMANEQLAARTLSVDYIGNRNTIDTALIGTADAPVQITGEPFPVNNAGNPIYPATAVKANQLVEYDNGHALHFVNTYTEVTGSWTTNALAFATGQAIVMQIAINGVSTSYNVADTTDATSIKNSIETFLGQFSEATFAADVTVESDQILIEITATDIAEGVQSIAITAISVNDIAATITGTNASNIATPVEHEIIVTDGNVTCDVMPGTSVPVNVDNVAAIYGTTERIYKFVFDSSMATNAQVNPIVATDVLGTIHNLRGITVVCLYDYFKTATTLAPHKISGIADLESHYVNGTSARQNAILDILTSSGMVNAFSDPTVFKCRYMVDTFTAYIEPNIKHQYATLAKQCDRFLVFVSSPYYYKLRSSKNPDFHDLLGNFVMDYVRQGKNPNKPSTNSFSFTNDIDGSKFIVPVACIEYNDGFGSIMVPATGIVAKAFYSKHFGQHKVYDIVAGQDYPLSGAGVVGPEFNPSQPERAAMEKMGMNVLQMITMNDVTSLQLRSNKTAFQTVESAFNYPETLEKVFYVSDAVEPVLDGTLYKYNNDDTRLAVKLAADDACQQMVADKVISSFNNVCDLSNNPTAVRKAGILVLDTELYNEYGIRIAVHRTTIKTEESN